MEMATVKMHYHFRRTSSGVLRYDPDERLMMISDLLDNIPALMYPVFQNPQLRIFKQVTIFPRTEIASTLRSILFRE
jgi:hypothetical protein